MTDREKNELTSVAKNLSDLAEIIGRDKARDLDDLCRARDRIVKLLAKADEWHPDDVVSLVDGVERSQQGRD